jgi:hypothetical protein
LNLESLENLLILIRSKSLINRNLFGSVFNFVFPGCNFSGEILVSFLAFRTRAFKSGSDGSFLLLR